MGRGGPEWLVGAAHTGRSGTCCRHAACGGRTQGEGGCHRAPASLHPRPWGCLMVRPSCAGFGGNELVANGELNAEG